MIVWLCVYHEFFRKREGESKVGHNIHEVKQVSMFVAIFHFSDTLHT